MAERDDKPSSRFKVGEQFKIGLRTLPSGEVKATVFATPLSDHPIYQRIGRVTAEWANFEHTLDMLIWYLVDIDMAVIGCVTGQMMGHAPRLNAIIALLRRANASEELTKLAQNLLNKSYEAANERNRVIHDSWLENLEDPDSIHQFRSMPPKDPRFGISPVGGEDAIEDTIKKIQHRVREAAELDTMVREEIITKGAIAFSEVMEAVERQEGDEATAAPSEAVPDEL
jgi:hypothetical protein